MSREPCFTGGQTFTGGCAVAVVHLVHAVHVFCCSAPCACVLCVFSMAKLHCPDAVAVAVAIPVL